MPRLLAFYPSQDLSRSRTNGCCTLALGRFGAVLDLGQYVGLNPDALVRDAPEYKARSCALSTSKRKAGAMKRGNSALVPIGAGLFRLNGIALDESSCRRSRPACRTTKSCSREGRRSSCRSQRRWMVCALSVPTRTKAG